MDPLVLIFLIGLFFVLYSFIDDIDNNTSEEQIEYIICAANHYDDGIEHVHQPKNIKTGYVVCGRRHHNCVTTFAQIVGFPYDEKALKIKNTEKQGFLTNTDRFVERHEALNIARLADQVLDEKEVRAIGLHSEDLY